MMTMTILCAATLIAADAAPAGRLSPDVSKEMMAAIVATNKALGLESWPMHDVKPCIDRGGQGITAKEVTPDESRKCAASAIEKGFPELGKSYVLAIPMAEIGPVTVLAIGIGANEGWGAYSCDPDRKCLPVKIGGANKWGKRIADRLARACGETTTLWFPIDKRACAGTAPAAATAPPPAAATAPALTAPAPALTAPAPAPAPTAPPPAKH